VLAKVPISAQAELKAAYWQIFQTDDLDADPGQQLVSAVQTRIDAFARRYGPRYPAAVRCLLADRAQLTTYLRFPPSTTTASATPTSSSGPSARPADA
jgi:putative transposase